ncbi:hypothetical protein ACFORH_43380 [Amycolatopsis roodepoortensis]|uniref:Uncharacterized protein n=1 Tax=Amycolatopsis roodepoortensis TaxID=700274 RepID=A0ABR9LI97_9PSEU|nr:hypothetical protein [Amycolatopsis roodepoortensis]MBE1580415.1 hypothetical protein [Amycolatopsis roodepoortensis]
MRTSARALIATLVMAAALVGFPAASHAGTVGVPGVNVSLYPRSNAIIVFDTLCDDDSVYGFWKTDGGAEIRINNKGGCGTAVPANVPIGDGTYVSYKACVDRSWPTSDLCSGWNREKI